MKIFSTVRELQNYSKEQRKKSSVIALVPTMGFLHEGHASLIDTARSKADIVILSLFVNPTQFGPNEDLDKYPKDFEHDKALCEKHGVDVIFAPQPNDMYHNDSSTWVFEEKLSKGLCGKSRPVHFRGVTTVVSKLFNAALPDIAVFGQKDAQQAIIIKRMVRDLNFPIEIIVAPIVREKDGLALSSRNKYLSADERKRALSISKSLFEASKLITVDKSIGADKIRAMIRSQIESAGGKLDYVETVDKDNLEPVENFKNGALIPVAAYFGSTRLIDNILV